MHYLKKKREKSRENLYENKVFRHIKKYKTIGILGYITIFKIKLSNIL